MTVEIGRALGGLVGNANHCALSAGWTSGVQLGLSFPLVVPDLGVVVTLPIVAAGLDSFMLRTTLTVAPVGTVLGLVYAVVRPDLSAWPPSQAGTTAPSGAVGTSVVSFGSPGRDGLSQRAMCPLLFRLELDVRTFGLGPVTFTAFDLFSMTRP